jgi:hypothetical protein
LQEDADMARIMCGPRARTNFPSSSSSTSFLSPALVGKLHRFNLASVRRQREAAAAASSPSAVATNEELLVEQMIEELLDSNFSMDICY